MKTCHMCNADFPSGLTCPECGAFVVDLPAGDSPAAPQPPAPAEPGSLGGWVIASSPEPTNENTSRALAEPAPGSLGGWVTPAKPAEPAEPAEPAATNRIGPQRASSNTPPPFTASSASSASSIRPDLQPAGVSPKVIATAVAVTALLVLVVVGVFMVRSQNSPGISAGGPSGASTDLVGTCIRYNTDRSMMEKTVPCSEPHSGQVVAYVTEQASCPPTTDSILTGKADLAGTSGVVCIDEQA